MNSPCFLPPCASRENLEGIGGVASPGGMPGLDCWLTGTFGMNGAPKGEAEDDMPGLDCWLTGTFGMSGAPKGEAANGSPAPFIAEAEEKITTSNVITKS